MSVVELRVDQSEEPLWLSPDGQVAWQPRLLDAARRVRLLVDGREVDVLVEPARARGAETGERSTDRSA